ncbi:MAG: Rossmann-like and DUF2520 domain-containing protein [Succinivibrio sp.]
MIGFIGAGKVGVSLGRFFAANKIPVSGFYSKSLEHAENAAIKTDSYFYEDLKSLFLASDIIFVTVPDREIADTDRNIFINMKDELKDKIFIHCSGALSSNEGFKNLSSKCMCASLHPMMAFSSEDTPLENIKKCFYTIECSDECFERLYPLIKKLNLCFKRITSESKTEYHLASVLASNCVTALFYMAQNLLKDCGFTESQSRQALSSLLKKNADNIISSGVYDALTGPVERNDINTVKKHLSVLCEDDRKLYALLSRKLLEIAGVKHEHIDYSKLDMLLDETKEKFQ